MAPLPTDRRRKGAGRDARRQPADTTVHSAPLGRDALGVRACVPSLAITSSS
eukprot:CAMPEP_0197497232 /NCGR_PEP_ID=MMETSP1311-20131121/49977_1 /TAXON_ID=464262 /ORGANISM="Genus nov. species nov., Strain RCC856" /LENGTH=51 /DNA_ID=CAMNT_0043042877 /DNA_START=63 /DNA_END=214 /DNA_ORIENTATION=-